MCSLKFRAWLEPRWEDDKEANKMYYDIQNSYDMIGDVKPCDICDNFSNWLGMEEATVEQYTGLKDKDGKGIYENDVIDWEGTLWLVNWDEKYARFVLKQLPNMLLEEELNSEKEPYWEVVDNIHENKDLLQ